MEEGKHQGLRVVVLVSEDVSDIYFANQLIRNVNVVGVIVERQYDRRPKKANRLSRALKYSARPVLLIGRIRDGFFNRVYGKKAKRINMDGFGQDCIRLIDGSYKTVYTEGIRRINDQAYAGEIKGLRPDVIAVCGTSILKEPILSIPPRGVLNLHGGLSQKYRGVWTTLWAIYNEEPQYIGATVHYVSSGIDDGDIIYQGSPEISSDDNHESLYVKVVKLGTGLMIRALNDIDNGTIESYPLTEKGKLYLSKHVTPRVIRETWKKVKRGVISDYVRRMNNGVEGREALPARKHCLEDKRTYKNPLQGG